MLLVVLQPWTELLLMFCAKLNAFLRKNFLLFQAKTTQLLVVLKVSLKFLTLLTVLPKSQLSNLWKKTMQNLQKKSKNVCSFSKISYFWTTVLFSAYCVKLTHKNFLKLSNLLMWKYKIKFSKICQSVPPLC